MPSVERSFLKDLKNMDPRLGVKFNGKHFVLTYKRPVGNPVNIYRVKAEDGSFRQPDKRDLMVLKAGDLAEGDSMDVRLKKSAYASELIRQNEERRVHEEIRAMTLDGRRQLVNAFKGESKGNATFRRIAQ
jgi:hypothetical protein